MYYSLFKTPEISTTTKTIGKINETVILAKKDPLTRNNFSKADRLLC